MLADTLLFGLIQTFVITWPSRNVLQGLKIDEPIEPQEQRFLSIGDDAEQRANRASPVFGFRYGDRNYDEDFTSTEDLSLLTQREWCPSAYWITPCTCDGPKQFVLFTCNGVASANTLQRVFQTYFPTQRMGKFSLINSEIETLKPGDLGHIKYEYIYMKKNTLKAIESGALDASKDTVKRIEIIHNDLEKFPFKNLTEFTKLEYLDLKYNGIKTIPDFAFGYHRSLKEIDLSFNKISYLGSYAFDRLPLLKSLNLSYNKLSVLNNHALASNVINKQLKMDLSHNQLLLISDGVFDKRIMEVLDLSHNNLKSFPENIFGKIVNEMSNNNKGVIVLNDNRFLCTCKNVGWIARRSESYKRPLVEFFCTDLNKYLLHLTLAEIGCTRWGNK